MEGLGRSCLWLRRELSPPQPQLLLLDCRSREMYESARIGGALSVALPALLLRRLRRGSLSVRALLPGPPLQPPPPAPVLLYDQGGGRHRRGDAEAQAEAEAEEWEPESVLGTLLQKLREEGYLAYYLQGRCKRGRGGRERWSPAWGGGQGGGGVIPTLGGRTPPSEGSHNSFDLERSPLFLSKVEVRYPPLSVTVGKPFPLGSLSF